MLFSAAVMIFSGLTMLIGFSPRYLTIGLTSARVIGAIIYGLFWRFAPKIKDLHRRWNMGWILLLVQFLIAYAVIPRFLSLTPLQMSLYYSFINLVSLFGFWISISQYFRGD